MDTTRICHFKLTTVGKKYKQYSNVHKFKILEQVLQIYIMLLKNKFLKFMAPANIKYYYFPVRTQAVYRKYNFNHYLIYRESHCIGNPVDYNI